jgi:hypothetical protein
VHRHKVINKNYADNENFYSISASHNGYEKKFGYIHKRSIVISKLFVLLCNNQPSPFDKLINIEFPAFVLTILVFG